MSHLKLVPKPEAPLPAIVKKVPSLYTGQAYRVDGVAAARLAELDGAIGDYHIDKMTGRVLPISAVGGHSTLCYLWDESVDTKRMTGELIDSDGVEAFSNFQLEANHLQLNNSQLDGPEIVREGETTLLRLSANFDGHFVTRQQSASLGIIHLVQSQRFAVLEEDKEHHLLDTGDTPVLYFSSADDDVVKPITSLQEAACKQAYDYRCTVSQIIPDEIDGQAVVSLTVLERYTSYFMQKPTPLDAGATIWLPAYSPITWGWSMRISRRFDGEWSIQRRKLMLPIVGHDGLQFPVWQNNSFACIGGGI